jgi:hypothetical protein
MAAPAQLSAAAPTPALDRLKVEIQKLLASGFSPALVEDVFIAGSNESAKLYERALAEYAVMPKVIVENGVTFMTGAGSAGRRSVAGFRQMLIGRA